MFHPKKMRTSNQRENGTLPSQCRNRLQHAAVFATGGRGKHHHQCETGPAPPVRCGTARTLNEDPADNAQHVRAM